MSAREVASVLVEIAWEFEQDGVDWQFCMENATFVHKEACEFIIHIGDVSDKDDKDYWQGMVLSMKEAECTEEFIDAYIKAKDMGATRVLFWS